MEIELLKYGKLGIICFGLIALFRFGREWFQYLREQATGKEKAEVYAKTNTREAVLEIKEKILTMETLIAQTHSAALESKEHTSKTAWVAESLEKAIRDLTQVIRDLPDKLRTR